MSTAVDPIEKKPLFHFLPGTVTYSLATVGCNFTCTFCQNADISQMPAEQGRIIGKPMTPEEIVAGALATGCRSISYTYTEPTIFYEYARDAPGWPRRRAQERVRHQRLHDRRDPR